MIKQKPILFSTEMVRAILDRRKTQTRRILKEIKNEGCPYGKIGDRLWVREPFCDADPAYFDKKGNLVQYAYKADNYPIGTFKWKPSIFMPKKASRITLEITNIRVERLNDISEQDAIAEGVEECDDKYHDDCQYGSIGNICSYKTLWESINGQGSWGQNPWVWVIEFKRVES